MSAHEISISLIGTGLAKFNEVQLIDIMNKRHQFSWCYESNEIIINDTEINIFSETKNCDIEKVIKNVKQYMPEVISVRYWCKPYWMNTDPIDTDIEMAFWTKNRALRKECFCDARVAFNRFTVIPFSWRHAWENAYKKYCENEGIEYIVLKEKDGLEFKDADGKYDEDLYIEYLVERYSNLDYMYLSDIENELYDSFVAYTTIDRRKDVTIWIH